MKIVVAPHMPILAQITQHKSEFEYLSLLSLPGNVTILVPENWDSFLSECEDIASDYELFSLLLELPVEEVSPVKKANYIRITPDILENSDKTVRDVAKQQLFALSLYGDSRRIYSGTTHSAESFEVSSDKKTAQCLHFRLEGKMKLKDFIVSFEPELKQLKHFQESRRDGDREVSAFSAYDKNDERYARKLLKQAYDEHNGDIDDRTYLYTYDSKNETFVEFRPSRGNEYHGQDVSIEYARAKAPDIVRQYHK